MDILEYLDRKGMLVHLGITEDEIAEKMLRVCQDCICEECGKFYYQHPYIVDTLDWEGHPYLRALCDGTIAKL